MAISPSITTRFNVAYKINFESGCWEWAKGCDQKGYGIIWADGKTLKAHRLSWIIHYGEIPASDSYHGTMVCHHCDNPRCVNPEHLFLGTAQDNNDDMVNKKRNRCGIGSKHGTKTTPNKIPRGETHGMARLTGNDVKLIRSGKHTGRYLASKLGVTESTISMIKNHRNWRHF